MSGKAATNETNVDRARMRYEESLKTKNATLTSPKIGRPSSQVATGTNEEVSTTSLKQLRSKSGPYNKECLQRRIHETGREKATCCEKV